MRRNVNTTELVYFITSGLPHHKLSINKRQSMRNVHGNSNVCSDYYKQYNSSKLEKVWCRSVEVCLLFNMTLNNKNNITNDIKMASINLELVKAHVIRQLFWTTTVKDTEVYQIISCLLQKGVPLSSIPTCE
jgi:hypothetical protein